MKFSGEVAFLEDDVEVSPGIWKPKIVLRRYFGEILRNTRRLQDTSNKQNQDFTVGNQISILSDLYAQQNWHTIKYVIWNQAKWKVDTVDLAYPRITLTLGGLYNENERRTS